ncbi:phage tail assembly protein T [Escherichia coli]|nr:phage tail assembly protein T [Escherichia coli]HAL7778436.1 phage tail assembly protein T [Escherichia coli]
MFDGELSFALKLAREMGRPDWRAMLAGMSSTEYADWHRFYSTHYFHDVLLDMHFSGLTYTVLSLFFSDYSAAIFLIPICISFDTAEKRRYATYLILNRRFSFGF